MKLNDALNKNRYKMRHKDHFIVVLKSQLGCFTLGEYRFHDWVQGTLQLSNYCYTCKCLNSEVQLQVIDLVDYKIFKYYIDDEDLQFEIYEMEDKDYNKRLYAGV